MFMLLCSNSRRNKYDPDTFINVRQVYGTTLAGCGYSIPVKTLFGDIVSGGNTLSIPVKSAFGTTMDSGADLQKPVKSVYGYLLVTET